MRALLLLVALLLLAAAAIIVGLTTAPDLNTVLALGFGGLAAWAAAELLEGRLP
jgi:hypothetical protein